MNPALDLVELNRKLQDWYAQLAEIEGAVTDPERRLQLRQALDQVRQGQSVIQTEYEKEMNAIAARTAAVQRKQEEILARAAALKAETEAPSVPAPTTAPSYDPADRVRLRDEFLARFARLPASVPSLDNIELGSVSKHWEVAEATEAKPSPPTPPVPSPPPLPPNRPGKRKGGDEIWEDLSTREE